MPLAVSQTLNLVSGLLSSARQLMEGSSSGHVARDLATALNPYQSSLSVPLEPLLSILPLEEEADFSALTSAELAVALQQVTANLATHVGAAEREYLRRMYDRLGALVPKETAKTPTSGIFEKKPADISEEAMEQQWIDSLLVMVGGAYHDASNILSPIEMELLRLKKLAKELCRMEVHFAEVSPIGTESGRIGFVESLLSPAEDLARRYGAVSARLDGVHFVLRDVRANAARVREIVGHLLSPEGDIASLYRDLDDLSDETGRIRSQLAVIEDQRRRDAAHLGEVKDRYETLLGEVSRLLESMRRFFLRSASFFAAPLEIKQAGEKTTDVDAIDLQEDLSLDQVATLMGRKVEVTLEIDDDARRIAASPRDFWKVLINLMSNARQAMDEGGAFSLKVSSTTLGLREAADLRHDFLALPAVPGDFIVLEARDDGCGIRPDHLQQIFQPFYSGRRSAGYGLAVALKIVRDRKGFIGVDSRTDGPGRGTTFRVYFPRAV